MPEYDQDFIDDNYIFDDDEDGYDPGEDCGRCDQSAKNGTLPYYWCRLAGTEFCDWECPFAIPRPAPTSEQEINRRP